MQYLPKTFYRKDKIIVHELCCRKERKAEDDTEENSVQSTAQTGGGQSSFTQERAEKDQYDTVQSMKT